MNTGSAVSRTLGTISVLGLVAVAVFGLVVSPPDRELGETIRILYMHVPTVSVAYLAFVITAVGSVVYLWKRSEFWDLLAASAAEIGVLFFALTIFDGMMWGKVTWGVFWRWEPRLGHHDGVDAHLRGYLVVRSIPTDRRTRGTLSAVIGIMAVVNIPITHKAVDWWRGLHQGGTVLGTVDPDMAGTQLFHDLSGTGGVHGAVRLAADAPVPGGLAHRTRCGCRPGRSGRPETCRSRPG
ncbi:MAG: cytochrome c biogenesis protein CcsA [Microthrixaceae bacterium]